MTPVELLSQLNRRGATLAVDGERLRVRPSEVLDEDLRAAIVEHKASLVSLVTEGEAEVYWRAAIMREQARGRTSLPFLVVRRNFRDVPGVCMSCDGPLDPGCRIRCTFCVRAVERVLNERLEGLQQTRPTGQAVGG